MVIRKTLSGSEVSPSGLEHSAITVIRTVFM